jgi:hypothetical protein
VLNVFLIGIGLAAGLSYLAGVEVESRHWKAKLAKEHEAQLLAETKDRLMRQEKNYGIGKQLAQQQAKERVVYQTVTQEIVRYVPLALPDIPGSIRVLHDEMATGTDPRATPGGYAASVSPQELAETVAANYLQYRETAARLMACQQYIREVVKPEGMK